MGYRSRLFDPLGPPAAMGTVLIVMGGIGTYAGYEIRKGNGERDDYFFTLEGKTVRDSHPLIMSLATFFFLLGGQGGLVLLLDQGKPILESTHALTAVAGLGLLALQALLPLTFEREDRRLAQHIPCLVRPPWPSLEATC